MDQLIKKILRWTNRSEYKLELVFRPNWLEIMQHVIPEVEHYGDMRTMYGFMEKVQDKKLDHENSLDSFRFVEYRHGSGLQQIWSDHHRTFVDQIQVDISYFTESVTGLLNKKEAEKHIEQYSNECEDFKCLLLKGEVRQRLLKILADDGVAEWPPPDPDGRWLRIGNSWGSPAVRFVGTDEMGLNEHEPLSSIPLWRIISLLQDISLHCDGECMRGISVLPPNLVKYLDENNVRYFGDNPYSPGLSFSEGSLWPDDTKWARKKGLKFYTRRLQHHWFVTKHLNLGISMEFF